MTIENNPENTSKARSLRNLVQITGNQIKPPWAVVEFPGTDREKVVADYLTAHQAFRHLERHYTEDECDVDVMKRLPNGFLTTEF